MFLTGKSTLLNHLFGTNFREMDAFKGRYACFDSYGSFDSLLKLKVLIIPTYQVSDHKRYMDGTLCWH